MPGNNLNHTERRLLDRWNNNFGPSLRTLEIGGSGIRGLRGVSVDFKYPLTVIAGKNGVGKSTILACASCAYQNRTQYRTLLAQKQYYTFDHHLVRGWGDVPALDVDVTFSCRQRNRSVEIVRLTKDKTRWSGYRKRPDRPVDFIGTVRAVHPCELKLLRSKFGTDASNITSTALSPEQRAVAGRIVGRDYSCVDVGEAGKHRLHRMHWGLARYSAFNAGSGEDISCLITRAIDNLPKFGLMVIEEVEMGLHPSAQRSLAARLLEACLDKEIQVICTSHSSDFLAAVPSSARVLLSKNDVDLDVRYGVTVGEATTDLLGVPEVEMVVCVEDRVAESLVLELTPSRTRTRIRVVRCGSWEDVLRHLASYQRDPCLGKAIGILDGDRRDKDGEHFGRFKEHIGGQMAEDQKTWLTSRLCYLPGSDPPEAWLWQLGTSSETYLLELASQMNADRHDIRAFFEEPQPTNLHHLPYLLAQRVGHKPDSTLSGLSKAAVRDRADELQDVLSFVQSQLDVG